MREKMHKIEKRKVNYATVLGYLLLQKLRNSQLRGTGAFCDMSPHADKVACKTCPEFENCGESLARRQILKENAKKSKSRRERRKNNPKRINPKPSIDDYLSEEEGLKSLKEESLWNEL